MPMPSVSSSNPARRRRPSKTASGSTLKRSASSPNVRGPSTQTDVALSLADKRRNKLGYHRTSVACVHCRRRKIRCLSAADDPQNRCSNCIRLKKECNFYPVDQQPTQELRARAGSKVELKTGSNSASSSSSPGLTVGTSADQIENFNHFPIVPVGGHPFSGAIMTSAGVAMSPPGSAAPFTTRFEFPDQAHRNHWDAQYYGSPVVPSDEHTNDFWMKPDTPLTPSYPSYPSAMPVPSNHQLHHEPTYPAYEIPKTESGWQPARSISYGHLDDVPHPQEGFGHFYHPEARRNTMDMLPPSLRRSGSSSIASVSEGPGTTLAGTGPVLTMAPQAMPLPWQHSMPLQSPKSMEFGGGWYPDPGHLAKVSEEHEPSPHYVGDQTLLYSGAHQ
ncbi:MAG: hypothetical protein LQ340_005305 [Diploschistes diacapsis]|nr:MAG: hypothetical protein LQ340_005305 [Diploschistes diacapsis]